MKVDKEKCLGCGGCVNACPVNAITLDSNGKAHINKDICIRCCSCVYTCPVEAISTNE